MSGASVAAPASGVRHWVVCADDFAVDSGAVEGILRLIERERLTATSALVDAPLWPAAAQRLLAAGTPADVGLHLNLTQSFAHRPQQVWPLPALILACRLGRIDRAGLRTAIERQLAAFEDAMGRRPDYIDGHQHVHQFAVVRDLLLEALQRRYGDTPPWIRSTRAPSALRGFKARIIATLGDAGLRRRAAQTGVRMSRYLVGAYDFLADQDAYLRHLAHWIQVGPSGSVLMCHPAAHAQPGDPIGAARAMEFAVLGGSAFPQMLAHANIRVVRGCALFAQR